MATAPRSKTFDLMKLAICVGIGVALGIVFRDDAPSGLSSMGLGPAIGVGVAYLWSKPEREAASRRA
ncbi:hypothetical protein [Nocardioides pantholopis]|uniref:hypothetical protein n=1 Tax=Nocardioides pantholopis TaxID=2483798 RepID=UPI000F0776BF|nr:hypothetical protein [Nocardioides pantholopis]